MPNCCEYFCESGFSGAGLAHLIERDFKPFTCEKERCSPFSPGPVLDEEKVAFLLIDPLHYDEKRKVVLPGAFQELGRRDLSVVRPDHVTKSEVERVKSAIIARGPSIPPNLKTVDEVCLGSVAEIRASLDESGQRLLAVYDTALEDNGGHASIFTNANAFGSRNKGLRGRIRNRIHEIMARNRIAYGTFVDGLSAA